MAGHEHCKQCGACLIQTAQVHKCPAFEMREDILEVFESENSRNASSKRSVYEG